MLRTIGNEAVHARVEFSRDDAKDALSFTEALIAYIFTYHDQFEWFKKRRAEAQSSAMKRRILRNG
jgi:hypothetical protein